MAKIITFYSYKGGTGRSMALANVAWLLASNGRRVLVVDWDLEAPGLHHYFRPFLRDGDLVGHDVRGVIDLVSDYSAMAVTPVPEGRPPRPSDWYAPYADISQCAIPLRWPRGERLLLGTRGEISLVPAGRQERGLYAERVNGFDWRRFYDKLSGGAFIDAVRERMQPYDYVLIDSRTGVSDTSGICTVQLPDAVVLCFTLNNQSITGAATVAASIAAQSPRKPVYPVPMRVDPFERDRLNRRRLLAQRIFKETVDGVSKRRGVTPEQYWRSVEVPYLPVYAYEELLAPFEEFSGGVGSMVPAIEQLTGHVTDGDVTKIGELPSEEQRREVIAVFRQGEAEPDRSLETPPPVAVPGSQPARNIVLLSDGTSNVAAKLYQTNVWRMYKAIDLSAGDQMARYDDGVGSSSFKLFAVLGGAVGWGLKRDVLDLYEFACRNYRSDQKQALSDAIYAFGFSRGASTIRVLIALIASQGLVTGVRGQELRRLSKWAYRGYRWQFNVAGGLATPLRRLRDLVLRAWEGARGLAPYDPAKNIRARIKFMGLWETVDAYGLPTVEMTRGWDRWVWPLSMRERVPSPDVEKICHAVALDDERQALHPTLFDESSDKESGHVDQEQATQVWFAGAHSDVGGGYADSSLAHVSLLWMAHEAEKRGLRLHAGSKGAWAATADPFGPIHNSRSGLGSYYRYNPRSIKRLTDDRFADVHVPRPKIHESVFARIAYGNDEYSPIVLPEKYAVVTQSGAIIGGESNQFEHPTQAASRCASQESVWNLVWWRRVAYFTTVGLTVMLFARPFVNDPSIGGLLAVPSTGLSAVIGLLATFLPDVALPWVEFYMFRPVQLVLLAGFIAGLLLLSTALQRAIIDRMRALWGGIFRQPATAVAQSPGPTDWVYRLRSHPWYRNAFAAITEKMFPFIFGVGCLAALVIVITGTANRAVFAVASAAGNTCRDRDAGPLPWDGQPRTLRLPSRELCLQTGLQLLKGQRYRVEIVLPDNDALEPNGQWMDKSIPVESPAGFSSGDGGPLFVMFLPFRRVLTAQWFAPMVRIGNTVAEYHRIDQLEDIPPAPASASGTARKRQVRGFVEFTPALSGQMFLFVNDAILPGPWLKTLYNNNYGTANVTVLAIEPDPVAAEPGQRQ